jgi:hypothetical protein
MEKGESLMKDTWEIIYIGFLFGYGGAIGYFVARALISMLIKGFGEIRKGFLTKKYEELCQY